MRGRPTGLTCRLVDASPGPPGSPSPELVRRLFPAQTQVIYRYVDLLINIGVVRGLLGPREAERVWERHILNCAVIAPAFPAGRTVCDVGSGAGLPGIVVAVARPDLEVTLLEPLLRRVTFLDEVVAELGLDNVTVRRGRAEEIAGATFFDVITARAVAPLDRLARWAFPMLVPGGELIAIKGRGAAEELAAARTELAKLGVGRIRVERYGAGIVDPETTVVRLESGRRQPRPKGASKR